jgi:hypothetical protein
VVETESLEKKFGDYISRMSKKSKLIPDYLPYRIMVVNMDKTIETVNKTFLDAYHLTEDKAYGKHCYELISAHTGTAPAQVKMADAILTGIWMRSGKKGIYSTIEEYVDAFNNSRLRLLPLRPYIMTKARCPDP